MGLRTVETGGMDIPTPRAVLEAYSNRLYRLSCDVEALARASRSLLPQEALTAIWGVQRDLLRASQSVRPGPPRSVKIPDHF